MSPETVAPDVRDEDYVPTGPNAVVEGDAVGDADTEASETTEEVQPGEEAAAGLTEKAKADEPKPYTDEEVIEILDSDGKLDSKRLTPTQRLVQRSFQKHAEKGYQDIAKIKKELESAQKEAAPPRTIEEAFDRDPDGVLAWIDGQIANMAQQADNDPISAVKQLSQLQATRNRLTDRALRTSVSRIKASSMESDAANALAKAIPDYTIKQRALSEFAISELGYSEDDMAALMSPNKGMTEVKVLKTINTAYDALYGKREKLKTSAESKKVTRMPLVEGAAKQSSGTTPQAQLAKVFAKAKETGDWTEYLEKKGVLSQIIG